MVLLLRICIHEDSFHWRTVASSPHSRLPYLGTTDTEGQIILCWAGRGTVSCTGKCFVATLAFPPWDANSIPPPRRSNQNFSRYYQMSSEGKTAPTENYHVALSPTHLPAIRKPSVIATRQMPELPGDGGTSSMWHMEWRLCFPDFLSERRSSDPI